MEEEILEETVEEVKELPDVYKKQVNPDGAYVDKDGNRYDILTCKITESKEQVQVCTTVEEDEEGNLVEVPVFESQVVINKGWDSFESIEEAAAFYDLTPIDKSEEEYD